MRRLTGLPLAVCLLSTLAASACSVRDDIFTPLQPMVSFVTDQSLTDESITITSIHVRLSEVAPEVVTVRYTLAGGAARPGADVSDVEGEVTFAPFEVAAMIALTVIDDGIAELEEDALIELRSPVNAALGEPAVHRLWISDDDI